MGPMVGYYNIKVNFTLNYIIFFYQNQCEAVYIIKTSVLYIIIAKVMDKKIDLRKQVYFLVGDGGFEPPKA